MSGMPSPIDMRLAAGTMRFRLLLSNAQRAYQTTARLSCPWVAGSGERSRVVHRCPRRLDGAHSANAVPQESDMHCKHQR
jgi:hypothetical protein